MNINESIVADAAPTWFGELGHAVGHGPQLAAWRQAMGAPMPAPNPDYDPAKNQLHTHDLRPGAAENLRPPRPVVAPAVASVRPPRAGGGVDGCALPVQPPATPDGAMLELLPCLRLP